MTLTKSSHLHLIKESQRLMIRRLQGNPNPCSVKSKSSETTTSLFLDSDLLLAISVPFCSSVLLGVSFIRQMVS